MKQETSFRSGKVRPFLATLTRTIAFPIQQKTIRGDADYILCAQGFFVWLELKTDEGKQDSLQVYKASCVKQTGGIVLVARPGNWHLIKNFLNLLDRGIYDKNELRAIEQYNIPAKRSKTNAHSNEESGGVQDHAHRETPSGEHPEDAGSIQKGSNVSVRRRRRNG